MNELEKIKQALRDLSDQPLFVKLIIGGGVIAGALSFLSILENVVKLRDLIVSVVHLYRSLLANALEFIGIEITWPQAFQDIYVLASIWFLSYIRYGFALNDKSERYGILLAALLVFGGGSIFLFNFAELGVFGDNNRTKLTFYFMILWGYIIAPVFPHFRSSKTVRMSQTNPYMFTIMIYAPIILGFLFVILLSFLDISIG